MLLETMPLTPGGKLNRTALPSPDRCRPELIESYLAPRTALEGMLTDVWTEVLGIEQVGVHDNFFELGGHSLLAMQVVARVREACGVELPLRALFEEPTVAGVAAQIQAARRAVLPDQGEMLNTVPGADGDTSGGEGSTLAERLLQDLERLSDEEAERLLAGESKEYPGR
jgi:acyl carrier protein